VLPKQTECPLKNSGLLQKRDSEITLARKAVEEAWPHRNSVFKKGEAKGLLVHGGIDLKHSPAAAAAPQESPRRFTQRSGGGK
jgi:hypothetical protein